MHPQGFSIGHTDLYNAGFLAAEAKADICHARQALKNHDYERVRFWIGHARRAKHESIHFLKLARAEVALDKKWATHDARLDAMRIFNRAHHAEAALAMHGSAAAYQAAIDAGIARMHGRPYTKPVEVAVASDVTISDLMEQLKGALEKVGA